MAALHRPALPLPRRLALPPIRFPSVKLRSGRPLVAIIALLVVVVALLQVNQYSRAASAGYQINDLNRQRAAKLAENHEVEATVAQLSSLARVDIEARVRLHMEPAQQRLYIAVNQPVPERETLPTRFLPPDPPVAAQAPPKATDPFWKRALHGVPFF